MEVLAQTKEAPEWLEGKISWVKHWTENKFSFGVSNAKVPFTAGQFTRISLNSETGSISRPFSFVNAPDNPAEFYAVAVAQGRLSNLLHQLQLGDPIWLKSKATGYLTLKGRWPCRNLYLFSTGTGIGPYLSLLEEGISAAFAERIILMQGVRNLEDIHYSRRLYDLQAAYHGRLSVIWGISQPCNPMKDSIVERLTNPTALLESPYEGFKHALQLYQAGIMKELGHPRGFESYGQHYASGRITSLLENGFFETHLGLRFDSKSDYCLLCGNPEMVRQLRSWFRQSHQFSKVLPQQPGGILCEEYWAG